MPGNDIVVLPINGLVAASEQNGSEEKGYVVFIRGRFKTVEEYENENSQDDTIPSEDKPMSKEARVAELYRTLVYYPFIRDIRLKCGMDPNPQADIPENLRAISWMDGCLGQLHLITKETVLDAETLLKITSNKQSPARTAVEQAADVGAMFKLIRSLIKSMPGGEASNSHIYHLIIEGLEKLENQFAEAKKKLNKDIVILPAHKKSAIVAGLSKLPEAMGIAFRVSIVKKAFQDNGQISIDDCELPNIDAMVGTYRGVIDNDHILHKKNEIVSTYYKEMYENGRIDESTFDRLGVVMDKDSNGNEISRNFGIHRETCQRAKVLSSKVQRQARLDLQKRIQLHQYEKHDEAYKAETNKYAHNAECEKRLTTIFDRTSVDTTHDNTDTKSNKSFISISQHLTIQHFGHNGNKKLKKFIPTIDQLKAFIQLRYPIIKFAKLKPIYKPLTRKTKEELILLCSECVQLPLLPRHYSLRDKPDQ